MNKSLSLIAFASLTLSGCVVHVGGDGEHTQFHSEQRLSLNASDLSQLVADTGAGDLEIIGVPGLQQVEVVANVHAVNADSYTLVLEQQGHNAKLLADNHSQLGIIFINSNSPRIDLLVKVPAQFAVNLDDGSGSTSIRGITGNIDVRDDSGELTIDGGASVRVIDGSGGLTISNVSGDLYVDDDSGELAISKVGGAVEVTDGSGNLTIEHVAGLVTVHDDSGELSVSDVTGDVNVVDGSGNLSIVQVTGTVTIDDGSGNITVEQTGGLIIEEAGSGSVNFHHIQGRVSVNE